MSAEWQTREEAGTRYGIAFVRWVALNLGRTAISIIMWPVSAYFLVTRRRERMAARGFLRRALGREPHSWELMRHFHTFGQVAVDRVYLLSGDMKGIRSRVHGRDLLKRIAAEGSGCVVLSSHLGSFEATRSVSLEDERVDVHVVIDRRVNPNFTRYLEEVVPEMAAKVIDASAPPTAIALRVAETLRSGGWIGIPADRLTRGAPSVECQFFGSSCRLPRGPFALAVGFNVPVVMATGLYLDGGYELYFEELPVRSTANRREREEALEELASEFSRRLERYARMAPMNWFNLYDFWDTAA
jgi:predicted LPLAT superfamily acyltransferase